jgi:hypothetical protein
MRTIYKEKQTQQDNKPEKVSDIVEAAKKTLEKAKAQLKTKKTKLVAIPYGETNTIVEVAENMPFETVMFKFNESRRAQLCQW